METNRSRQSASRQLSAPSRKLISDSVVEAQLDDSNLVPPNLLFPSMVSKANRCSGDSNVSRSSQDIQSTPAVIPDPPALNNDCLHRVIVSNKPQLNSLQSQQRMLNWGNKKSVLVTERSSSERRNTRPHSFSTHLGDRQPSPSSGNQRRQRTSKIKESRSYIESRPYVHVQKVKTETVSHGNSSSAKKAAGSISSISTVNISQSTGSWIHAVKLSSMRDILFHVFFRRYTIYRFFVLWN